MFEPHFGASLEKLFKSTSEVDLATKMRIVKFKDELGTLASPIHETALKLRMEYMDQRPEGMVFKEGTTQEQVDKFNERWNTEIASVELEVTNLPIQLNPYNSKGEETGITKLMTADDLLNLKNIIDIEYLEKCIDNADKVRLAHQALNQDKVLTTIA